MSGCKSSTDETDVLVTLDVDNDDQFPRKSGADEYEAALGGRVHGIGDGDRERVTEGRCRLLERPSVLREVRRGLVGVPRELHGRRVCVRSTCRTSRSVVSPACA
jgi:hypothetical protein